MRFQDSSHPSADGLIQLIDFAYLFIRGLFM